MRSIMQKWGKHIAAVAVFLVLTVVYFAPAVFEGKSIRQGDMEKAVGMGGSQMEKYEKSAQPGEFSVWSDAMFGGMPYAGGYGNPAPKLPGHGIYRFGMFLYIDVCNGGELVAGPCGLDRFCVSFL